MRYRLDVTYPDDAPQSVYVQGTEMQADAVAQAMAQADDVLDVGVYLILDSGAEACTGFFRGPMHPQNR